VEGITGNPRSWSDRLFLDTVFLGEIYSTETAKDEQTQTHTGQPLWDPHPSAHKRRVVFSLSIPDETVQAGRPDDRVI
jgi:hypothetical protein